MLLVKTYNHKKVRSKRTVNQLYGAGEWIRTTDLRITSALLYRLSYTGNAILKKNGGPNEIWTRVAALKGLCPRPLDDRTARW